MGRFIDLTGKRFGRLEVIKRVENINGRAYWLCKCDCGNEKVIRGQNLREGSTKSCGCFGTETRRENCKSKNQSTISDSDMIGKQFEKLTVIEYAGIGSSRSKLFRCLCECGNETVVRKSNLINGLTKSCGCLSSEVWSKMTYKHGYATHKEYNRLYAIWSHMIDRCHNENNSAYQRYGARGITVCDEWIENIDSFIDWAHSNGYSDNLSLDRKNNDKGYSPDNCRWADDITQANNKRNNIVLEYNGEKNTISQWAKLVDIPRYVLANRYYAGWSAERILTEPVHNTGKRKNGV